MEELAIQTDQLSKTYDGKNYALKNLTIDVRQGEVFGFLGPNGAGKTTTVKLLNGLLKPSSGSCSVMGYSSTLRSTDVHSICGVMTDSSKMYAQMTGMENLIFFAQTYEIPLPKAKARAEELLKKMDLWDARDKKLGAYSTGMAQRLSLARTLVNHPKILFLDEPTSGLDPESAKTVNCLIDSLAKEEGVTVFLCTHQLRYAQDICGRYGIIEKGQLLTSGTLESIAKSAHIFMKAAVRVSETDAIDGFERCDDGFWKKDILREDDMPNLLKKIVDDGHEVYEAIILKPTLEDIYFHFVKNENGEVLQ
jgi:ABC-2 type transport system ATP-binding protein